MLGPGRKDQYESIPKRLLISSLEQISQAPPHIAKSLKPNPLNFAIGLTADASQERLPRL